MSEIDLDEVREAYATGDPEYTALVSSWAEAGVDWAADIIAEAEIDAELEVNPLAGVDQGELEAFIAWGRKDPAHAQAQLAVLQEDDGQEGLVYSILELAAADDQPWAQDLLLHADVETETAWNDEVEGRTFDPDKFDKAWFAASENGEPEAAMGYYTSGRLEADPPLIEQRWARPHEVIGGEDKAHVVDGHSDNLDHAFSEWFVEDRNRRNGRADAPPADPEPVPDAMTVANLGSIADEWNEESAERAEVQQHKLQLQRRAQEARRKGAM